MHLCCSLTQRASTCHCLPSFFFLKSLYSFTAATLLYEPSYHVCMIPMRLWPCNYTQSSVSSCLFSVVDALVHRHFTCTSSLAQFPRMRAFPGVLLCRPFLIYVHMLGVILFQPCFFDYEVSLVRIIPRPLLANGVHYFVT